VASIRATYPEGSRLKRLIAAMAKIGDEADFRFTSNDVTIWLFSPDKTVLSIAKMESSSFEEYSVDSDATLTVNISELHRVARRAARSDAIVMSYETGAEGLKVELQDKKTSLTRSFLVTATESPGETLREINMSPTARLVISAGDMEVLISDAKSIGDIVEFHAIDDKLEVTASSEGRSYTWTMQRGAPLQEISVDAEAKASYSTKSLYSSLRPLMTIAESVTLEFSTDYPLKVSLSLSGPEQVVVYVAPVQG